MKILIILFLIAVLSAAFDQVQGTFYPKELFLNNLKMILPEYFSYLVGRLGSFLLVLVIYFEATEFKKQIKVAMLLVAGWCIDFLLEGNRGWIDINGYAFGYRSSAFIVFGVVLIYTIYELWKKAGKISLLD